MAVAQIKHFDFLQLYEVFVGMCPDFQKEISYETPSISRLFAEKIIFDFSAQIKNIKKSGRDHTWKVDLKSNNEEDIDIKPIKYKIYISTNLFTKPSKAQPKLEGKKLKLSFKQASLVAVFKYCQVIPFITQRGEIVFTPLAGAVFNKEFLPSILAELVTLQKVPVGMHNVLIGIICSCQTDGFYLPYSVCHIAVVAICCTVKDLNLRESLVKSTIKQYQRLCKPFDERKFKIYMFYANKQIDVNNLMSVNVLPCEQHKEPLRSSSVEKTNDRKVLDYVKPTPSQKHEIPKKSSQTHYGKSNNVLDLLKKSGLLKRNAKQKQDELKKSNELFGTRKQTFKAKAYLPKRHKVPTDEGTSSDKESTEEESSEEDTSGGETDEESDLDEKLAKIALKHL